MAKSRLIGSYPVIGIRPTIDGRRGALDVRGSLEDQTMNMAKTAAKLFEENLRYSNGEPVKVVIADTTIGRVGESAACADKFRKEGVDITLTVTPCWCYGAETMDMDPQTIKAVWGFNGTERPVDEHYGIHPKIYLLTERGMTEQGRDKFFARMLSGKEEIERFEENKPCRDIDEQREELRLIREQSVRDMSEMHWDRVYISEGDVIFPVENQRNWWRDRVEIITLSGGHYPFYVLDNWEKIWK